MPQFLGKVPSNAFNASGLVLRASIPSACTGNARDRVARVVLKLTGITRHTSWATKECLELPDTAQVARLRIALERLELPWVALCAHSLSLLSLVPSSLATHTRQRRGRVLELADRAVQTGRLVGVVVELSGDTVNASGRPLCVLEPPHFTDNADSGAVPWLVQPRIAFDTGSRLLLVLELSFAAVEARSGRRGILKLPNPTQLADGRALVWLIPPCFAPFTLGRLCHGLVLSHRTQHALRLVRRVLELPNCTVDAPRGAGAVLKPAQFTGHANGGVRRILELPFAARDAFCLAKMVLEVSDLAFNAGCASLSIQVPPRCTRNALCLFLFVLVLTNWATLAGCLVEASLELSNCTNNALRLPRRVLVAPRGTQNARRVTGQGRLELPSGTESTSALATLVLVLTMCTLHARRIAAWRLLELAGIAFRALASASVGLELPHHAILTGRLL